MRSAVGWAVANEDWFHAAIGSGNLSELRLTLGEVAEAIALAKQSVDYAGRSDDAFRSTVSRAAVADALHQAGERAQAEVLFQEAERLQEDRGYPPLYGSEGYWYRDLLLDFGRHAEVRDRAEQTLEWGTGAGLGLLAIALDHLSLGRAELLAYETDGSGDLAEAETHLNRAVDALRKAGTIDQLPRGLLARAACFRITAVPESFARAQRELDEVFRIATRSGMRLFECDAHLEYARPSLRKERARLPARTSPALKSWSPRPATTAATGN
jgi:tetratricopeptide (TPR) repeat protein